MNSLLTPGKYIVATSGGVDSMALLDMLVQQKTGLDLIIAHVNHGIRPDSKLDAELVDRVAQQHDLPFETVSLHLGPTASEDQARQQRYKFLHGLRHQYRADAIVTAHHQDDVIETAVINVIRGTKRRGLVSLQSTNLIKRPLLTMSKVEIKDYARGYQLAWREDSTNNNTDYLRNRVRAILAKSLSDQDRADLLDLLAKIRYQDASITLLINSWLADYGAVLPRIWLNQLGLAEAYEITAQWLKAHQVSYDQKAISRLVIGARTLTTGNQIDIQQNHYVLLSKNQIILKSRSSV